MAGAGHPPWAPSYAASLGPRPSTPPGEPPVAGTGMAGRSRTGRRAIHHRPRFDHLRDPRPGQGGRPPLRLHRRPGLPPAAGHRRRHRGRADGPAARGPRQHRSGCFAAGTGPVVWERGWWPPRPSAGGSSLSPDGSAARRAASPCISPGAGPGKPSSVAPWPRLQAIPFLA